MSAHQATEQENILQAEKGQNRKAIHQTQACTASDRTSWYRKKMPLMEYIPKREKTVLMLKERLLFLLCSMKQAV